jgi:hypothetical protein
MTDNPSETPPAGAGERESKDEQALAALLKRTAEASMPKAQPDLLQGVQRKLRQRSKGKFYADGWSTANTRLNYALIALVMLVIILVAYFALGPVGITAH